jgi:erythromycin esterase-like protein
MGARLPARLGDRLAAVGFTALGGHSSMAGQPRVALPPAPAGSLEARATEGGVAWAYLDAAALRTIGRVPSRLLGSSFASADWSTLFDAVVVFREEVAPTFDPWR